MASNRQRSIANLAMLESMAKKLDSLTNDFVFLGGSTTALLITDPAAPDIRYTVDVDCIVDVISLNEYHQIEKKLRKLGFEQSHEDNIICRWRHGSMILDVMPTDQNILGFGNRWYKAAIANAITHQLSQDLFIKTVTAPYFLATKLEAFKQRGKGDFLESHDFEDIIAVIDGRAEIENEVANAEEPVRQYLYKSFAEILENQKFHIALPGHLNYGPATENRVHLVTNRIRALSDPLLKNSPSYLNK